MATDRIGDILSRMIPLSRHDIEEILQEQRATHRPFGDIALSMGLCQPENIWQAWSGQLDGSGGSPKQVDLAEIGVDSQAVEFMTGDDARRWCAIPVRVFGDELVIAIDQASTSQIRAAVNVRPGLRTKFVLAPRAQIEREIESYYGAACASAA